jgi:hypothetical protein
MGKKEDRMINQDAMYQKIMFERFGIFSTLRTASKILVGKKA